MDKKDVKILVVEDEEIIRVMFQQSFMNWGFQVDMAENGKIALDMCQENMYHIVVTDLNMPVMDGMELLKRVKARWPFTEVVVVTGFATIESAIEAMKLGAYDFILKPVNFDQVQFTINKCFQKIRAQAENTELRELNARLIELNELKDKFIYITNHEIRTPLTILKGYLEILRDLVADAGEETREVMDILENTANELHELVDRMHMLEGLEQASAPVREELVDLKEVIKKVYREIAGLYQSRQIDLKVYLDNNPLLMKGDYRQIRFVLRELLQNALKFTPDGGKVRVRLELINDEIHYSVKDTGIGIPFEKQEMVFEKFYEIQDVVHHKTSNQEFMGGGLGIGLSLVKEMVNGMKGRIVLESESGQGSLFKVILPSYQVKQEAPGNVLQGSNNAN